MSRTPIPPARLATTPATPDAPPPFSADKHFDLLISGGEVIDGSGAPARRADVLIDDGRVVHVGAVAAGVNVNQRIDASSMVVTPGFVDMHAHGAPRGNNRNALAMGVTTICIGQDGRSPSRGPLPAWLARLAREQLAVNVVALVGHATVRAQAGVGLRRDPSAAAIERMVRLVREALQAGAWGLSTGLEYAPGSQADGVELAAIARPVAEVDGVVMSHLRSEDDDRIDAAIDELLAQGRSSGARVHVAHIKVVYGKGAARADRLLAKLGAARRAGVQITADIYPYLASYTGIGIVFPDFAKPPHDYHAAVRRRRAELEAYLRDRVTRRGGPTATLFGTGAFRGLTLAELAKQRGRPFEQVLIDMGPYGAGAAYFVMDDALQSRLLVDPLVAIGSDGGSSSSHPRGYGAFAKIISEYVVRRGALSITEAVRKMTGLAAHIMRLDSIGRGQLAPGAVADVLVFDPQQIHAPASYQHPHRLSTGMRWVLVAGQAVIADGKPTGRRAGRLLLRPLKPLQPSRNKPAPRPASSAGG